MVWKRAYPEIRGDAPYRPKELTWDTLDVVMGQKATFCGPGGCCKMRPLCLWDDQISVGSDSNIWGWLSF